MKKSSVVLGRESFLYKFARNLLVLIGRGCSENTSQSVYRSLKSSLDRTWSQRRQVSKLLGVWNAHSEVLSWMFECTWLCFNLIPSSPRQFYLWLLFHWISDSKTWSPAFVATVTRPFSLTFDLITMVCFLGTQCLALVLSEWIVALISSSLRVAWEIGIGHRTMVCWKSSLYLRSFL